MTITHSGSTGLLTATTDPSPYDAAYCTGVAAGSIAIMFITTRGPSTTSVNVGSFADTWNFIASEVNATASHDDTGTVNDAGLTRLSAFYRVLTGAETGAFTYTTTATTQSASAVMSIYQTDQAGGWLTPPSCTGSDDGHLADRTSLPLVAWNPAGIAPNDWIVWGMSSDTDTALTITAPAITSTSTTYGTVTHRNRNLNGNSGDCGVYSFDTTVATGTNTNAPTMTFTSATNQCGAHVGVRLREAPLLPVPPLTMARWT
jgi:hypothetical protein